MKLTSTLVTSLLMAVVTIAVATPLAAVAADDTSKADGMAEMKSSASATLSDGEVKKIDKEAGKITIKHGPLANLDMPSMTMVFRVKEPAMLDQVKSGDKIKFAADKINGALVVTTLEADK